MEHQGLEGLDPKGADGLHIRRVRELDAGGRHHDDGRDVQGHHGLRVGVVAEEHLAAQAASGLGHLTAEMPDEVHVGVPPIERHPVLTVPRIGVGDGEPAERRPVGLRQRTRDHCSCCGGCVCEHRSLSSAWTQVTRRCAGATGPPNLTPQSV